MKKYIVRMIEEPEFGCEGQPEGYIPEDMVMLEDEEENTVIIRVPDAELYEKGIYEDDEVYLTDAHILMKYTGEGTYPSLKAEEIMKAVIKALKDTDLPIRSLKTEDPESVQVTLSNGDVFCLKAEKEK